MDLDLHGGWDLDNGFLYLADRIVELVLGDLVRG